MFETNPESSSNAELRELAARTLGSGCRFEDRSRRFGRRTITWRITATDGTEFYLKRHEHRHHHAAEVFTLWEWVPLLAPADWWCAASVVLSDEDLGAVILTALPGQPLSSLSLPESKQAEVHRLAGRLASQLHALDADTQQVERTQLYDPALKRRYLTLAKPHLPGELFLWVERACADDDAFEGPAVVPTHSDYSPRNWVVEQAGSELRLGLID